MAPTPIVYEWQIESWEVMVCIAGDGGGHNADLFLMSNPIIFKLFPNNNNTDLHKPLRSD